MPPEEDPRDEFHNAMAWLRVKPMNSTSPLPDSGTDDETLFQAMLDQMSPASGMKPDEPDTDSDRERARTAPRRMKPGRIHIPDSVDACLDLHGKTVAPALEELRRFLFASAAQEDRWVLVITGKGHHSPTGTGVLRSAVESWIREHGHSVVKTYSQAPRHMGGGGAWILRLWP